MSNADNKILAYHATTLERARQILESGVFKYGTYFAYKTEDALNFAGPVVFACEFQSEKFQGEPDGWQFHLISDIPLEELCTSHHWSEHSDYQEKRTEAQEDTK